MVTMMAGTGTLTLARAKLSRLQVIRCESPQMMSTYEVASAQGVRAY